MDIKAFVKPVAVLQDLDGDSNTYFALKDRTEWSNDFVNWLEEPSEEDLIEYSDLEESDENSKTSAGEHLARNGGTDIENDVHSDESSSDVSV